MPPAKDISLHAFVITCGLQLVVLAVQGTCDIPLTIQAKYLIPIMPWVTIIGLLISFAFGVRSLTTSKAAVWWMIPSGIYLGSVVFLLIGYLVFSTKIP